VPGTRDFSFSGLKTAVLRHVTARRTALGLTPSDPLPEAETIDISASFQRVVVETLLDRLFEAARWSQAASVGIAGGVSANSRLRADAELRGRAKGIPVFVPDMALSTDNAAMIAAAGLRRLRMAGADPYADINAEASLAL
jgi:N6-L-threonylcarbamoyladenine synthase